jgi:hypothetical protein
MELLQNRRYKDNPDEIADFYFQEIKTQIETIIELCQEGIISAYETAKIIYTEIECSRDFQYDLCKMLNDLEKGNTELLLNFAITQKFPPDPEFSFLDEEEIELWKEIYEENLLKSLGDTGKYEAFLVDEAMEKVEAIFDSADYQKKRKEEIKQKIIKDGLPLPLVREHNTKTPTHKTNLTEIFISHLVTFFPEFHADYPLLEKHGYLENTGKGLRWKKSKQALAEYFHSIKVTVKNGKDEMGEYRIFIWRDQL